MACYQLSLQRSMLAILFYYLCLCNISTLAWKESSTSIKVSKVYKSHMALHTSSRPDQQDTVSQQPSIFKAPKKLLSQISVAVMITSVFDVTSMKLPVRAEESITATTASEGIQRLQTTIQKLEQSDNRADTVQAMADLFEAIQAKPITAKSLKVRTRIVNAINDQHVKLNNVWDKVLSFESNELKRKVDPFRTVDLAGYLRVLPYLGAVSYLITLAIQQKLPELFNAAYPAAAAVIFIPIIFIILTT